MLFPLRFRGALSASLENYSLIAVPKALTISILPCSLYVLIALGRVLLALDPRQFYLFAAITFVHICLGRLGSKCRWIESFDDKP